MATGPDGELVPQEVNMGMEGKSISNYDLNSLPKMLKDIRADILIKMGVDQGQFNQSMTQENLEIGRDAPLKHLTNTLASCSITQNASIVRQLSLLHTC